MNVWADEGRYVIEADLPGFRMADIEVSVLGDEVTIKGARKGSTPETATLLRRERRDGEFERTFTLPKAVAGDKVEATLNDGVLRVTLPLTPEAQPRRIEVKARTN
jgi:HSP20 family protein